MVSEPESDFNPEDTDNGPILSDDVNELIDRREVSDHKKEKENKKRIEDILRNMDKNKPKKWL